MSCSVCGSKRSETRKSTVITGTRERLIKLKKAVYAKYRLSKESEHFDIYMQLTGYIRSKSYPEEYVIQAYEQEYYA